MKDTFTTSLPLTLSAPATQFHSAPKLINHILLGTALQIHPRLSSSSTRLKTLRFACSTQFTASASFWQLLHQRSCRRPKTHLNTCVPTPTHTVDPATSTHAQKSPRRDNAVDPATQHRRNTLMVHRVPACAVMTSRLNNEHHQSVSP